MAKIFTHDCKKCKTETEHTVVMQTYSLHVTCKVCGTTDNVPIGNSATASNKSDNENETKNGKDT